MAILYHKKPFVNGHLSNTGITWNYLKLKYLKLKYWQPHTKTI